MPLGNVWSDTSLSVVGFEGSVTLRNVFTGDNHTLTVRRGAAACAPCGSVVELSGRPAECGYRLGERQEMISP